MIGLYLYYSIHSTWNQLRKVFKTWLFLIALAAMLGGGLIGLSLTKTTGYLLQAPEMAEISQQIADYFRLEVISRANIIELVVGFLMLSILALHIITAETSASRLFLPADVNFLFASDRTPQEVLTFRILSTIGTAVVAIIYLTFQAPSLSARYNFSNFTVFMLVSTFCISIIFSILFKVIIYEVTCKHPILRNNLRYILFTVFGIIAIAFYFYYKSIDVKEQVFLFALNNFFNAPWTRFIPVYGWVKGMAAYAVEGDNIKAIILFILCIISIIAMWITIRLLPADYYEDATIRSEEVALYMSSVNSNHANLLVLKPHAHNNTSNRDGFHYGSGPTIYFFKPLFNRFRFAKFGIFSKTMVTYLFACFLSGAATKSFLEGSSILPYVIILIGLVFFHTVLSPLSEDIRRDSFTLIPENTWLKLLCSIAGGSVNCILDTVLPLFVGAHFAVGNGWLGLAFLPVIVSVDFFATVIGTFIDIAIPSSVDKTFKQVLQVLLLYLALIPDALAVAAGVIRGKVFMGFLIVFLINLFAGLIFFGLTGVLLDPVPGNIISEKRKISYSLKNSMPFCLIGVALCLSFAVIFDSQLFFPKLSLSLFPNSSLLYTLSYFAPLYLLGFPLAFLFLSPLKTTKIQQKKLTVAQSFSLLPVCFFLMYLGNFIGLYVSSHIQSILPSFATPETSLDINIYIQIVCAVLISPVLEELLFRKAIISKTVQYGELLALVLSSLLFGLYHGNFQQFFYAFFLGLVFGTVYLKTGNIKYSIFLHIIINFMGSVIAPLFATSLLSSLDTISFFETEITALMSNPYVLTFLLYVFVLFLLSLLGMVICAYYVKSLRFTRLKTSIKNVFLNPGMVCFFLVALCVCFS